MIKIEAGDAEELQKLLGRHIERAAKRAALGTAMKIVQKITTMTIPAEARPPIDRRIYAAGFRAKPTAEGANVTNDVPYADIIEHGARAENIKIGRAMIDALTEWVLRKGIAGKRAVGKAAADQRAEARSIAWAVAKNFQKQGIFDKGKGLKIVAKSLKGIEKFFAEELGRELGRE